jgi:hypothetical protein
VSTLVLLRSRRAQDHAITPHYCCRRATAKIRTDATTTIYDTSGGGIRLVAADDQLHRARDAKPDTRYASPDRRSFACRPLENHQESIRTDEKEMNTIIEIRPERRGWKSFEAAGVEPVFPERQQAIDYARCRASFRAGEIRLFDHTGKLEETISFDDQNRNL